jgi:hypothetical protein
MFHGTSEVSNTVVYSGQLTLHLPCLQARRICQRSGVMELDMRSRSQGLSRVTSPATIAGDSNRGSSKRGRLYVSWAAMHPIDAESHRLPRTFDFLLAWTAAPISFRSTHEEKGFREFGTMVKLAQIGAKDGIGFVH